MRRSLPPNGKGKDEWYSLVEHGLSPAKALGLTQDQRRCAMTFCTARRLLKKANGNCANCAQCKLCGFFAVTKANCNRAWPDLPGDTRDKLCDLQCSPDFPPLPGFSNFPDDPLRQESRASIEAIEIPDPCDLHACSQLAKKLQQRARNGWLPYTINRSCARAAAAAMRRLMREPVAVRDADFEIDRQMEEAKAEARRTGQATITIKLASDKRANFDGWVKQIQEYDKTGREFPLLVAIRRVLLQYPCLKNALNTAALVIGID